MRSSLDGRRGWTTVLTLALALVCLVGGQLYAGTAARASGPTAPAAAASAGGELVDRPVPAVVAARAAAAQEEAAARAAAALAAAEQAAAEQAAAAQAAQQAAASLCSGEGWQQRRGAAALASLGPRAGASGFTVAFAGARSGYLGLTHLDRRLVEVFVRDCDTQSDALLQHVVAHELGHAYDTAVMTDASRAAYQAARGIPASTPWYGCSGCADFATPAGDFAEVYAQWLRGAGTNRSELAGDASPAELARLAAQFFGG